MGLKKIAIVINTSWNVYNFRIGLLKSLQEDGYDISVIAPKDEYSSKLEAMGFSYCPIDINNKGTNPIEEIKLIKQFYDIYKKIKPDIILQYTIKPNIYGSFAAGLLSIPVISNISGLGTVFLDDSISSKIARFLYKLALKFPKKVFYQNPNDRQLFIDLGLVKEDKTDLLPGSGINTQKFKPMDNDFHTNADKLNFLFIARLVKDKGLIEYIEAAKQLRMKYKDKVTFSILGSFYPGNPTAITEKEMQEWQSSGDIIYLGVSDDVKSVIARYDCIVLPSYREGLSRVLLEAASMAKPIVTTDVPGCKEVVDDGVNGYLCKVRDKDDLAKTLEKMLLLDVSKRLKMGQKGREKILREFDESIVIDKYKKAIETILIT